MSTAQGAGQAPRPLYRDPIHDGPTDPVLVWNRDLGQWWMFYTARRPAAPGPGVGWVHGTDIGIAVSDDAGASWLYIGTARGLAYEPGRNTYWAPEVFWAEGCYHMFVSYIRGVPDRWEGHPRRILHYTSDDLLDWRLHAPVALGSEKAIDAAVHRLPGGGYRMWFKDEDHDSHTYRADSTDLLSWGGAEPVITGRAHEGPNVFALGGWYWLIVDEWRGLAVYRSADLATWTPNGLILGEDTRTAEDDDVGRHADVVEAGDGRRAYVVYFSHPCLGSDGREESYETRRSWIRVAALHVRDGRLVCDREEPVPAGFLPIPIPARP
ncbi:hypothetical protein KDL01_00605 [Actinospica durhamensis]|uniref:Glycosyl hydrolase n=1 Tax=Actinospica durhamensis TaxID=1508375 RepID=A0A941EHZ9_9ACTN|nr:hypothetical protein [Actinospica durhamensis]MBR7831736.1 hypothetical protein [Actinospica durhamensis]